MGTKSAESKQRARQVQEGSFKWMAFWGGAAVVGTILTCVNPWIAIPTVVAYGAFAESFRRNEKNERRMSATKRF